MTTKITAVIGICSPVNTEHKVWVNGKCEDALPIFKMADEIYVCEDAKDSLVTLAKGLGKKMIFYNDTNMHSILRHVAYCFGVPDWKIPSRDSNTEYTMPRHVFCHEAKNLGYSYSEIGRFINRTHATVIHSDKLCRNPFDKRVRLAMKKYEVFKQNHKL